MRVVVLFSGAYLSPCNVPRAHSNRLFVGSGPKKLSPAVKGDDSKTMLLVSCLLLG